MSYSMRWKKLKHFLLNYCVEERPKISILIPFKGGAPDRERSFKWVLAYLRHFLPDAEIVIGRSNSKPFSKTQALNHAARRAHGKVLVILDADAYFDTKVIERCADRILEDPNDRLWFVPYRHLYRLTKEITKVILQSDPTDPYILPDPLPPEYIDGSMQDNKYGHRYGAMIMIFPREALDVLGCFDERFKGWGGEDIALLRALDTLYGKHKTVKGNIYHLWHAHSKVWDGQKGHKNSELAMKYHRASRQPSKMRELVDEACKPKWKKILWKSRPHRRKK